jgi:hypothetical protein
MASHHQSRQSSPSKNYRISCTVTPDEARTLREDPNLHPKLRNALNRAIRQGSPLEKDEWQAEREETFRRFFTSGDA